MTKNSSDHGDLIVLAIMVSLALHAAMMFFAAPQVMSHVGVSSKEPKRMHRPPMAVKRFEGDPFRERVKTEPKVDVPAPREAPMVEQTGASPAPASETVNMEVASVAPAVALPEILAGPPEAAMELPKPSLPTANAIQDTGFTMPSSTPAAPTVAALSVPVAPAATESFIPTPGLAAPEPEFTLPKMEETKSATPVAMAGIESSGAAPRVEFTFNNKVLEGVDEGFVEKEKAAVKQLLSVPDAAPAERGVRCGLSVYTDPADAGWRYFKVTLSPRTGLDALPIVPKDAVILIDASGSIGKDRIRSCREVAKSILRSCLNSGDRFNLVAFRNSFEYAFQEWRECDAPSFAAADRWLSGLTAHGRTDVFSVIRSVLTLPRDPARPVIALVVTDGDANAGVSDTAEILSRFTKLNDGLISVYMYGVKKEANRELIELLTRGNRGESFIHSGLRLQAGKNLEELAMAFRDPVLTDLRVVFAADTAAETYPRLLKNLYKGHTVELYGRCPASVKKLVFTLQGLSGKKAFEALYQFNLVTADAAGPSLRTAWLDSRSVEKSLK